MNINRKKLEDSLYDFIHSDNGIIIGPPGIGKTFLLKKIHSRFKEQNVPYLYLPIDKFDIESNQELENMFGFKGDFIDLLSNLSEIRGNKGFLLVDSFDSAKSEKSIKYFLNLIERVKKQLSDKWQIIVSVRTFDAKKSQKLLELFPLSPEEKSEYHSDDICCRHFLIPELTDLELTGTLEEIIGQPNIPITPNSDIWNLLRIPFNIWLFEQLLVSDDSINELQNISSQIELLDLFWKKRVHDTSSYEEKEIILKNATKKMVKSKKLFVHIEDIYQSDKKDAWRSLLSEQIFVETSETGQNYAFSHNILFDYAVSILLLGESEDSFISFISEDISRQLFLRPSLDFYFIRLWKKDRDLFWKIFWKILQSEDVHLKLLVRLTQTNVIIREINDANSFLPIITRLKEGNREGTSAVKFLLQAQNAINVENDKIWVEFLDQIEKHKDQEFVWNLIWTLFRIVDRALNNQDLEILGQCGKIGRKLLEWTLVERSRNNKDFIDRIGPNLIVPIVAKTFRSNPADSAILLRDVLEVINEPNFPIMYIYRLVEELDHIWPYDTDFVELVYCTVLGHTETSKNKTSMGSPVLPLSSTRRQDYEMCYHFLLKQYPKFLNENPLAAIKIAIISLNEYIIQNHILPFINEGYGLNDLNKKFKLNQTEISLYSDSCYVWDTSGYREEPLKIADKLFEYIDEKAEQKDEIFLDNLFEIFYDNVKVTFFWRRLLISAEKDPSFFAPKLFELCTIESFISNTNIIQEMADFIEKSHQFFEDKQLLQIEKSILNVPNQFKLENGSLEYSERKRNRLLTRIPKNRLKTAEGREIRIEMEKSNTVPKNEPLIKWGDEGIKELTEEDFLKFEDIDLSKKPNKALYQLFGPFKEFSSKWLNEVPDGESIIKILPMLKNLCQVLSEQESADIKVKNIACTHLASCVSIVCRGLDPSDIDSLDFCKKVLLKCASHPEPIYHPEYDETFDSPSWSSAPRNEAAIGLLNLASKKPDDSLLEKIKLLAVEDQVPSVRYLTVSRLLLLWESSPEFVWEILGEVIQNEHFQVILNAACRVVFKISPICEERANPLLEILFEKTLVEGKPDQSNPLPSIIVGLAIFRKNSWAITKYKEIIDTPEKYSKYYGYFVLNLSKYINPKFPKYSSDIENRVQAIKMLDDMVEAIQSRIKILISDYEDEDSEDIQKEFDNLYSIIHEVVIRIFFAIEEKETNVDNGITLRSKKERNELYISLKPLIEKIIKFSNSQNSFRFNARTLHYIVNILDEVVEFDPKYVIHTIASLIENCERSEYSLDPLATDQILKFGEKIIADYKDVLQEKDILRDFIIIFDSFIKSGDDKMMNFVWRLDEIYR